MSDATLVLRIRGSGPGSIAAFRRQLARPEKLLKLLGIAAASEAQLSFDRQGLHFAEEWPERYPGMEEPIVNVAGALMDLARGPRIKPHRFENRPAVIDTGMLRRSLAPGGAVAITGTYEVQVGTTIPYGSLHQFGGEVDIPISKTQQDNLRKWYNAQKRDIKKLGKEFVTKSYKFASEDDSGVTYETIRRKEKSAKFDAAKAAEKSAWLRGIMKKLGFILNSTSMHQRVIARPFVGMNDDLARNMRKLAVDFFAGKGTA